MYEAFLLDSIMKAIQTVYNGYKFRSRLEARWAVFFDSLGVRYEYEPEGFVLNDGTHYLPDFYLPEISFWGRDELGWFIEVKPDNGPMDRKWDKFAHQSETPILLVGNIPFPDPFSDKSINDPHNGPHWWFESRRGADGPYVFCECEGCGEIGIQFEGRSARIKCPCNTDTDRAHNYDSERLIRAYADARSARFEHGETP